MEDNVRIFHMTNGGMLIGSATPYEKAWKLSKPMILSLRPHPTIPNKMQIMMQKLVGDPADVPIRPEHCVIDYKPSERQLITEYIRMATGIELATEMPKGQG